MADNQSASSVSLRCRKHIQSTDYIYFRDKNDFALHKSAMSTTEPGSKCEGAAIIDFLLQTNTKSLPAADKLAPNNKALCLGVTAISTLYADNFHGMIPFFSINTSKANTEALGLRKSAMATLQTRFKCDNIDPMIPFLALTYLDRLVSTHQTEDLFVISCLTIAWKLRTKSFKLDSFRKEVKSGYKLMDVFSMDIDIQKWLDWRVRSLMDFLPRNEPKIAADKVVKEFIVRVQADIKIYRPSIMAAYAVSATASMFFPQNSDKFATGFRQDEPQDADNAGAPAAGNAAGVGGGVAGGFDWVVISGVVLGVRSAAEARSKWIWLLERAVRPRRQCGAEFTEDFLARVRGLITFWETVQLSIHDF